MEHTITPDMSEAKPQQGTRTVSPQRHSFSLFEPQSPRGAAPDFGAFAQRPNRPASAAPIITRIKALQAILESPDAYASRMAHRLARQRKDQHAVLPGIGQSLRALGAEIAAQFAALAEPVFNACLARPARVGPRPRPPPRIRQL